MLNLTDLFSQRPAPIPHARFVRGYAMSGYGNSDKPVYPKQVKALKRNEEQKRMILAHLAANPEGCTVAELSPVAAASESVTRKLIAAMRRSKQIVRHGTCVPAIYVVREAV